MDKPFEGSAGRRGAKRSPEEGLVFLQGFLKRPQQVASIVPSSRFLERRIVRVAGVSAARMVVELGPGTGGTTRALLRAMRPDARLLAVEINAHFLPLLSRIADARLTVEHGGAGDLLEILRRRDLPPPDAVLSGIPFSTLSRLDGEGIVRAIWAALAPGGCFVAYQVRDRVESLGSGVFGPARVEAELLNVPPMRVYRWDKPTG